MPNRASVQEEIPLIEDNQFSGENLIQVIRWVQEHKAIGTSGSRLRRAMYGRNLSYLNQRVNEVLTASHVAIVAYMRGESGSDTPGIFRLVDGQISQDPLDMPGQFNGRVLNVDLERAQLLANGNGFFGPGSGYDHIIRFDTTPQPEGEPNPSLKIHYYQRSEIPVHRILTF